MMNGGVAYFETCVLGGIPCLPKTRSKKKKVGQFFIGRIGYILYALGDSLGEFVSTSRTSLRAVLQICVD